MMSSKRNFLAALIATGMLATAAHADDSMSRTPKKQTKTTTTTTQYGDDAGYQDPTLDPTYRPQQEEQQSVVQNNYVPEEKTMRDETIAITPELGMLSYSNPNGAYTARAMAGVGVSYNFTPLLGDNVNKDWYFGLQTAGLYSHNGSASGNFFGTNSGVANADDANLVIIPANVKIGYDVTPGFRVSAHGGGNVIYRSTSSVMFLGNDSNFADSSWKIYPNAGLDFDINVAKNININVRGDDTITPGVDVVQATLGVSFINL